MNRREFVEYCVLQKDMDPGAAVRLFAQLTKALAAELDPVHLGQGWNAICLVLDGAPPAARRSMLAFLAERYDAKTGEMKQ